MNLIDDTLRDMFTGAAERITVTSDVSAITGANARQYIRSRGRRPLALAMVVLAAVLVAGLVIIATRDHIDTKQPQGVPPPALIAMVPKQLAAGLTVSGASISFVEPGPLQLRLYANSADPTDTSRFVSIQFGSGGALVVSCDPGVGTIPFRIGDVTANTCTKGTQRAAIWTADGLTIFVVAGSHVGRDDLVQFARSLIVSSTINTVPGVPSVNVSPSPSATSWVPLVADDVAAGSNIRQASWGAQPSDPTIHGVVTVSTATDAPAAYLYSIAPVDAERVRVRNHDGFVTGSGNQLRLWWTEIEGTVVSIRDDGLFDRAALMTFADSLEPVNATALTAFATEHSTSTSRASADTLTSTTPIDSTSATPGTTTMSSSQSVLPTITSSEVTVHSTLPVPSSSSSGNAEQTYLVVKGDVLAAIAERFCVQIDALAAFNHWLDGQNHLIGVGDRIRIPAGACIPS